MTTLVAGTLPINVLSAAGPSVCAFLTMGDATAFRAVCREARASVADQPWTDYGQIVGSISAWRACFPRAKVANLTYRPKTITDADLAHLAGIHTLNIQGCSNVTDAGLAHLEGIKKLNVSHVPTITDVGLSYLAGIQTLDITWCPLITDNGIAHLKGIKCLTMQENKNVTDECLVHLQGIHTLDASWCKGINGPGLHHLRGIKTLSICGYGGNALAQLTSLEYLDIRYCYWAKDNFFRRLTNLHTLVVNGCYGLTYRFLEFIPEDTTVCRFGVGRCCATLLVEAGEEPDRPFC